MDGYTLSISRCSGGDGVEESFKAKIKRREAALDAFAVAEAYCKGIGMVSRCEPEHIDFSGASVERGILNNRNWRQHFLKAMCMADADIEFIGEDNVPFASYTYVVTGAYDNFGGKEILGAEEYLSRINIKVYEGDENGNLVFEGGAAECLAWADGYCGHC